MVSVQRHSDGKLLDARVHIVKDSEVVGDGSHADATKTTSGSEHWHLHTAS
jgi:hypothetical protein